MTGTYVDTMRLESTDFETWLEGCKTKVDEFSEIRYAIKQDGFSPDLTHVLDEHYRAMAKLGNAIGALCHAIEERDERIDELEQRIERVEEDR